MMNPNSQRYLLNAPVLTAYGLFRFEKIDLAEAKSFVASGFISAVGHASASAFLSALLGQEVPAQRITIAMQPGDEALVLRFLTRLPEGAVLTAEQMAAVAYELGLLTRLE